MFCRNCGHILKSDSRFCPNCGLPIDTADQGVSNNGVISDEVTVGAPPQNTVIEIPNANPPQVKKKKVSGLSIAAFVLALTVILCPIALILAIIDLIVNKGKKHVFSIIAIVISILFIISWSFGTIMMKSDSYNTNTSSTTYSPKATKAVSVTPKPTPTPYATEAPIIHEIGETVVFDDIEVTINSITFSAHAGGFNQLQKADSGMINCVIDIDVKNLTTKSLDLGNDWPKSGTYSFKLISDGENEYLGNYYTYRDFFYANSSIPAKGTLKNKKLNFIVPIELKDDNSTIELRLSYNSIWKDGLVIWKLR